MDRTAVAGCSLEEHNWGDNFGGQEEQGQEYVPSALAGDVVGADRVEVGRAVEGHVAENAVHSATGSLNSHQLDQSPDDQEFVHLYKGQESAVHCSQLVGLEDVVGRCSLRLPAGCMGKMRESLLCHHDFRLCLHEYRHHVVTAGDGVAARIHTEDVAVGSSQEEDRVEVVVEGSCIAGLQTLSHGRNLTDAGTRRSEGCRKECRDGKQNENDYSDNRNRDLPKSNERELMSKARTEMKRE